MRSKILSLTVVLPLFSAILLAQSSSIVIGKWQGEERGSPVITLDVTQNANGVLTGTAVFFVLDTTQGQAKPEVLGRHKVVLLDPRLAGNVFFFKIKNRQGRVTMNPSAGEKLGFRMTLSSEHQASLQSDEQESTPIKMVKQE